ncbi:hypothetical protein AAUPMB_09452, partial [Pasteurella multocida subsp. multocida str. Anand1_buffalo]
GLNLIEQDVMPVTLEQFSHQTLEEIMSKFEATVLRKFYEQYPSTTEISGAFGCFSYRNRNKLRQYGI